MGLDIGKLALREGDLSKSSLYRRVGSMPYEQRCRLLMKIGKELADLSYSSGDTGEQSDKRFVFTDSECNKGIRALTEHEQSILLCQIAGEAGICKKIPKI